MGAVETLTEHLRELVDRVAPPGWEDEVREYVEATLEKYCDDVHVDTLGNVIGTIEGSEYEVMIAAHMDEVGFIVKSIDKNGFIRFAKLGGIDDKILPGSRVVILNSEGEKVPGVIGTKPPHIQEPKERRRVPKHKDLFIDIGASDREEAEELVSVGDVGVLSGEFVELAGSRVGGRGLDDKIGVAVLLALADRLTDLDGDHPTFYLVGTVQEEVGLKGAKTSAFEIYPDGAIVLDTAVAGDVPGVKRAELKLGKGPAITVVDASGRGLITHPKVKRLLIETAEKLDIPYQLEVGEGGTTDATAIHLTRGGVPTGVVGVPTRYLHSPSEVLDLEDAKHALELVTEVVQRFPDYVSR
ncbi:M42 family metallopeptidase [Methanopyrus sp.]